MELIAWWTFRGSDNYDSGVPLEIVRVPIGTSRVSLASYFSQWLVNLIGVRSTWVFGGH